MATGEDGNARTLQNPSDRSGAEAGQDSLVIRHTDRSSTAAVGYQGTGATRAGQHSDVMGCRRAAWEAVPRSGVTRAAGRGECPCA